jgi:hypothetical protein
LTEHLQCAPVIKRQHQILVCLFEPSLNQCFEFLGLLFGQVLRIGAVHIHVVQLPLVFVEFAFAADRGVDRAGLPSILPDAAASEHGVILTPLLRGRVGLRVEGVAHRDPRERDLLHALMDLGHLQPADIQDRPLGHGITRGSRVPPAYSEYRLNILNGIDVAAADLVG